MRFLITLLVCAVSWTAELSPYEIVRRSCERDSENLTLRQQYTYRYTGDVKKFDKNGTVKDTESAMKEVVYIDGTSFSRVIAKDGKPLLPKDAQKEQEKFEREIAKRKRESPDQRRKRLADEAKELKEERELRMQVAEAFTFNLLGEETVNGRECYRIAAEPKPGFQPKGRAAGLLPKLKGTLWIDKKDFEWVRVDAETLDTISFGLALVRVGKGARLEVEQSLVNNELWAPTMFRLTASARAMLLLSTRFDALVRFHDYKKYSVESVVTVAEGQ
jgi:hypothetical protein